MAAFATSRLGPSTTTVPLFLAPAFAAPSITTRFAPSSKSHFSSTTRQCRASATRKQAGIKAKTSGKPNWTLKARPTIDRNKTRGVSAINRTGPKSDRGLWKHALPVPVARDHRTTAPVYEGSDDHGLWGFFEKSKRAILPPDQESSHGRSWQYYELAIKSFDDLHRLYWVCVKELNATLTRENDRGRLRAGYGEQESGERVANVKQTMTNIRNVLMNRQLSYTEALQIIDQCAAGGQVEGTRLEDVLRDPDEDDTQPMFEEEELEDSPPPDERRKAFAPGSEAFMAENRPQRNNASI